jgi:hypothetical protein
MIRKIRLYPSESDVYGHCKTWLNVELSDRNADEIWIDSNQYVDININGPLFDGIKKVCFYDFFHAHWFLDPKLVERIIDISKCYPTIWYTCNAKQIEGIQCQRFDYLWNRSKWATLEGRVSWKHISDSRAYARNHLHWNQRPKKYLSLNRALTEYRVKLVNFLSKYDGYMSNISRNQVIGNEYVSDKDISNGVTVPPSANFFDCSYISCQVESQYDGTDSVIFTEKTYDHLIRGRVVLNFGPPGYYSCLEKDGWHLPKFLDLSWDNEINNNIRFDGYLDMLDSVLGQSIETIHHWFLSQKDMIEHNYNMLYSKPYDFID